MERDLFAFLENLISVDLLGEVVSMIFIYFDRHMAFYQRAFETEGQNSFEEILTLKMTALVERIFDQYPMRDFEAVSFFSSQSISHYYGIVTVIIIKLWLQEGTKRNTDVDQVISAYKFFATHSFDDVIDIENPNY